MSAMTNFYRIENIEQRLFYYICGFSFFLPLSIAVGNIFLTLSLLGLIHRLIRKHDDVAENLRRYRKIFLVILVLLLAVFFSALTSGFVWEGIKRFAERYIYHVSILFPVFLVRYRQAQIIFLVKCLLAGMFFCHLSVIFQAVSHLSEESWRFGGVLDIMPQGTLLTMSLPIYALLFMHLKRRRFLALTALIVGIGALILNGTRGAWLATLILIPTVILLYSKKKLKSLSVILSALILIGGIFAVTPRLSDRVATITDMNMQSNAERMKMWQSALNMFEDHPILGIGYGQYATAYQTKYILPTAQERFQSHAHNNLIQMLAECGSVGFSAFIFMWIYFSYFTLRGWLRKKNFACLLFFCVLSGLMLHGLTEFNFETAIPSKIFWYSLGLCLAYCRNND